MEPCQRDVPLSVPVRGGPYILSNCGLADCIIRNFRNGQLAQVLDSCPSETQWMMREAFAGAERDEAFRERVMPLLDEADIAAAQRLARRLRLEPPSTTTSTAVVDDAAAAAFAIQCAYYWLSPGPITWTEEVAEEGRNMRRMCALLVAGWRSVEILILRGERAGRDLDGLHAYTDSIAAMTGLKTIVVEEHDLTMVANRLFEAAPPSVRFLTIRNSAALYRAGTTPLPGRPLTLPASVENLVLDSLSRAIVRMLRLPATLRTLTVTEPNGCLGALIGNTAGAPPGLEELQIRFGALSFAEIADAIRAAPRLSSIFLRRCCILGAGTPALASATRGCPSSFGPDIEAIEMHLCFPALLPRARNVPASFSPAASTAAVLKEIAALHACPRLQTLDLCLDLCFPRACLDLCFPRGGSDEFFERFCQALAEGLRNKPNLLRLSVNTKHVLSPDQCARLFEVVGRLGATNGGSLRTFMVCGVDAALGSIQNERELHRTCTAIGRLGSLRSLGIRLCGVDRLGYNYQAEWPPFAIIARILQTAATCNPALEELDTGRDPQMVTSIRGALVAVHEMRRHWHRSRVAWETVARGMLLGKERRRVQGLAEGKVPGAHLLSTADRLPAAVLAAIGSFFWGPPAPLKLA